MNRDINQAEASAAWAHLDLIDARNRRQKGNSPGFAGYRQRGRAEARIAKRRRARANRRVGQLMCREYAE